MLLEEDRLTQWFECIFPRNRYAQVLLWFFTEFTKQSMGSYLENHEDDIEFRFVSPFSLNTRRYTKRYRETEESDVLVQHKIISGISSITVSQQQKRRRIEIQKRKEQQGSKEQVSDVTDSVLVNREHSKGIRNISHYKQGNASALSMSSRSSLPRQEEACRSPADELRCLVKHWFHELLIRLHQSQQYCEELESFSRLCPSEQDDLVTECIKLYFETAQRENQHPNWYSETLDTVQRMPAEKKENMLKELFETFKEVVDERMEQALIEQRDRESREERAKRFAQAIDKKLNATSTSAFQQ